MAPGIVLTLCPGPKAGAVAVSDRCVLRPRRGRRTASTLCPGPKAGAVGVFGLAALRNGLADFPMHRASRWIVQCSGSAGARAVNPDRVIKSNTEFFNTGTWAGDTWR